MDVILQGNGQPVHERGARGDCVAVKQLGLLFDRNLDALLGKLLAKPCLFLLLKHMQLIEERLEVLEWPS